MAADIPTLNQNTTGTALISGGVAGAPSWGKIILTSHVAGTLPVINGGSGQISFTAGQIHFGSFNTSSSLFWDNTNNRLGIGTASPNQELEVASNGDCAVRFSTSSGTHNRSVIELGNVTGSKSWEVGTDYNYNNGENYYIWQKSANTDRMVIDNNGSVLVATSENYTEDPAVNRKNGFEIMPTGRIRLRAPASGGQSDFGIDGTSGSHIGFYTDNGSSRQ